MRSFGAVPKKLNNIRVRKSGENFSLAREDVVR
jgi:hypothetical protein